MKKILLGIIAFMAVIPMLAQVQVSKVYETYPGNIVIGLTPEQLKTDPNRPATITLAKGNTPSNIDITLGDFKFGIYTFKNILLKNVTLTPTEGGDTFQTLHTNYLDAELKKDNGETYLANISIDNGAKGSIKNGKLEMELTINYNDTKIYTYFKGEMITTGIYKIQTENKRQYEIYDLTGKRVYKTRKGIYIINGRKVVVR